MIIVKGRELLIPNDERYIGTTYDTEVENRQFKIPRFSQGGVDLAALTFHLDLQYANESYDTVLLTKDVTDAEIILTWEITASVMQVPGTLYVGIRALDGEATVKWSSFTAAMYVERHLNTPGNYTGDLTEIEQMEADHAYMKRVVNELRENLDYRNDAEAWAVGKRQGEDVPDTDDTYHNNSKYYAQQAAASSTTATGAAAQAVATVADTNTRFDNAIAAVTSDTEVADARVGADAEVYTALKGRLDAEYNLLNSQISPLLGAMHKVGWSPFMYKGQYVNLNTGIRNSSPRYCRTNALWYGYGRKNVVGIGGSTYEISVRYYGQNGDMETGTDYLGGTKNGTGYVVIPENAYYFAVNVHRLDNADMTDEDVTAITAALEAYTITDPGLVDSNVPADAKATGNRLAALACQREVDKTTLTILDYYMGMTEGTIQSSGTVVKTLYFECESNVLYRIDHGLSTRFVAGCFDDTPALNSVPTSFVIGTSSSAKEDATFILTDATTKYLACYYYTAANNTTSPEDTFGAIHIYSSPVDNTLTRAGIAADAKAAGDAVAGLKNDLIKVKNSFKTIYTSNDDVTLVTTYAGVIALYDNLVSLYPDYVTRNTLTVDGFTNYEYVFDGRSYNSQGGRRGEDAAIAKPMMLICTGVHGYERASVMSLYTVCKAMCENDYGVSEFARSITLRVIPIVCPWGYTNNSRVNENGVNINRNFDAGWTQTSEGSDYSGASPADQSETQVVQNWINAHPDALALIDWHNSNFVTEICTLAGTMADADVIFKKRFLRGIDKVIPYWQRERQIDETNIYAYGGSGNTAGTCKRYAVEAGLLGHTFETSWNVIESGKHSNFSIGVGAEAFANMLIGLKGYYDY